MPSFNIVCKLKRLSFHSRHLNGPTMALSAFYTSSVLKRSTLHSALNRNFQCAHPSRPVPLLPTKRFILLKICCDRIDDVKIYVLMAVYLFCYCYPLIFLEIYCQMYYIIQSIILQSCNTTLIALYLHNAQPIYRF